MGVCDDCQIRPCVVLVQLQENKSVFQHLCIQIGETNFYFFPTTVF